MEFESAKKEGRFRIGLIVPSSNTTMEVDFYNHLEPKATVHIARMYLDTTTKEAEEIMVRESTPQAADMIRTLYPHVTVFGCTSGGSLFGMDYDRKIADDLSEWTGAAKTVTVLGAVGEQLAQVGAKRIAVFTPYIDELNETIKNCLEEDGIEVLSHPGDGDHGQLRHRGRYARRDHGLRQGAVSGSGRRRLVLLLHQHEGHGCRADVGEGIRQNPSSRAIRPPWKRSTEFIVRP